MAAQWRRLGGHSKRARQLLSRGGTTSRNPSARSWTHRPKMRISTAVEKTIPICRAETSGYASGSFGWEPRERDAVRPDRMPPRLRVVPPTLRNTQDAAASLKSPRALNDRARRCPPDRAATQSAPDPLLRPGGAAVAIQTAVRLLAPDQPDASNRSGKSKQKFAAASTRLSQLRRSRHVCGLPVASALTNHQPRRPTAGPPTGYSSYSAGKQSGGYGFVTAAATMQQLASALRRTSARFGSQAGGGQSLMIEGILHVRSGLLVWADICAGSAATASGGASRPTPRESPVTTVQAWS